MVRYLPHAKEAMTKRGLRPEWVEDTIVSPNWTDSDPRHPGRIRSFKSIAAIEVRVPRVVHWLEGPDIVVLTVHPDRNALMQARRR